MNKDKDEPTNESSKSKLGGMVLALLALAIFINYVERGNLAKGNGSRSGY